MTNDLDSVERLAISIARSVGRLRVYVRMPNAPAPAVLIAHEHSLLERRLQQLHEVETFGSEPGWSAETIHDWLQPVLTAEVTQLPDHRWLP